MNNKIIVFLTALSIMIGSAAVIFAEPAKSPEALPKTTETVNNTEDKVSSQKSEEEKNSDVAENAEEEKPKGFPEPNAQAAIVIDRKSGDILYEKNKDEKLYPASTTKIMTAVLALENGVLSDSITATQEAIGPITNQHSHMGIKVGETLTLEQLLYGMMVYSANDAANVIGIHIGGNLETFAGMMNQKAIELGLTGTQYKNAHGFHEEGHYTTANDLAILTKYAMQNEKFCEIVKTVLYRIAPTEYYPEERVLSSTNHLVSRYRNTDYYYKYAQGVKTGYTDEAGNCLVSAATKGDMELIAVVLKADHTSGTTLYAFSDSKALYEYAFENYKYCKVVSEGDVVSDSAVYEAKNGIRVALSPAETVEKLLPVETKAEDIKPEIVLNEKIRAPISKGDVLGRVSYVYQGQKLAETDLIAGNDVERDYLLSVLHTIINIITSPFFFIPAIVVLFLLIRANSNRKKRRRQRRNNLKYANQPKE